MSANIQSLQESLLKLVPLGATEIAVALTATLAMSLLVFLGSLLLIPWLLARIPERYFASRTPPPSAFRVAHPALGLLIAVARNLLGLVLLLMGLLMLFLPGQGILTIVAASFLLHFPRKYQLQRWMVRRPAVLRSINWLRHRLDKPPLHFDE